MKNLQFNPYQHRAAWGWSKKFKLIPALPRGIGLKSHSIPAPPIFAGQEKPARDKVGRGGSSGAGQNCHSYVAHLN